MKKLLLLTCFLILLVSCENSDYSPGDIARLNYFRQSKDDYFKISPASPIQDFQQEYFTGLKYFPPNGEFRFQATLIPKDSIDMTDSSKIAGYLHFKYQEKKYSLLAFYENDSMLFVPFKDMTNGKETYEGGRYLDIPVKKGKPIILDFNYAYNPYCAYNPNYVCKIPPRENLLSFAIRAGEKKLFQK